MQRTHRTAFTLLEIVLVMAVIVVIAAITYPSLDAMYGQARVTAGGDAFKACMLTARGQAVEDGLPYRVAIIPGQGNFRAAPNLSPYWSGKGEGSQTENGSQPIIYEEHLPLGVVFSELGTPIQVDRDAVTFREPSEVSAGDYKTVAVYLPDGTAQEDYQVLICSRGGSPLKVTLRSLTGEVKVSRHQQEGGR